MNESVANNNLISIFAQANKIAIIPSEIAGTDAFCAAVGLYYVLKDQEKNASLIYTGKIPEGCNTLIKEGDLTSNISERELMISIDYSDTPAAKVHYSTENDILYLKIKPVNKDFDLNRVKTTIKGSDFDLIIVIGAQNLKDLGQVYTELIDNFNTAKILNIDASDLNSKFGLENVVDSTVESLSLLVLQQVAFLSFPIGKRSGKAFLTGITHKSTD